MNEKRRPSRDQFFAMMTAVVAQRSTCLRLNVGAVLVKENRVIATAYNGAPRGLPHCTVETCLEADHCRATIHAEEGALLFVSYEEAKGSTLYITHEPCERCAQRIIQMGVERVVYLWTYGVSGRGLDLLKDRVKTEHLELSDLEMRALRNYTVCEAVDSAERCRSEASNPHQMILPHFPFAS